MDSSVDSTVCPREDSAIHHKWWTTVLCHTDMEITCNRVLGTAVATVLSGEDDGQYLMNFNAGILFFLFRTNRWSILFHHVCREINVCSIVTRWIFKTTKITYFSHFVWLMSSRSNLGDAIYASLFTLILINIFRRLFMLFRWLHEQRWFGMQWKGLTVE